MNLLLVLFPDKKLTNNIFLLRNMVVKSGFGKLDPRAKTLPHISLVYFKDKNPTKRQMEKIVDILSDYAFPLPVHLKILKYDTWDEKIAAILERKPLISYINKIEKLLEKNGVEIHTDYTKLYGNYFDMKILRRVHKKDILSVTEIIEKTLPNKLQFNKIALIEQGCEEKDFPWQKKSCPRNSRG